MKKIHLLAVIFTFSISPLFAQDDSSSTGSSEAAGPRNFWQASLPGGDFTVALTKISSVSKHSYVIDGNLRVTEVVVDTLGNSLARFYYIIPVAQDASENLGAGILSRGKDLLDQAGKRTGQNLTTPVTKNYPTTTHAKTVEFNISDEDNLNKLYDSVKSAWIKNSGKKFTIKEEE
ncbi:MAG: hypothetical protein ACSHX0_10670 [Akkermansiaceae bacterium]